MSALAFPKPVRLQDADYLRFIRRQACLICSAASEAHHVGVGGVGTKCSDFRTVPLCPKHHREYHRVGRQMFENVRNVDLDLEQIRLLEQYVSALKEGEDLGGKEK